MTDGVAYGATLPADRLTEIAAQLDAVGEAVQALRGLPAMVETWASAAEREHERAAAREAVIDRLHAENQQLRRGELQALLEPIRNGLFRLYDMARQAAAQCRAAGQAGADLLEAVADEAATILVGVGVERFDAVVGEAYDADRHRPVAVVAVTESHRDGTVAATRTSGFATADRVVRRADVVLARFTAGSSDLAPVGAVGGAGDRDSTNNTDTDGDGGRGEPS